MIRVKQIDALKFHVSLVKKKHYLSTRFDPSFQDLLKLNIVESRKQDVKYHLRKIMKPSYLTL